VNEELRAGKVLTAPLSKISSVGQKVNISASRQNRGNRALKDVIAHKDISMISDSDGKHTSSEN
jgi:hypothetical protein